MDIGREAARRAAAAELAKPTYPKESWWDRLVGQLLEWVSNVLDRAGGLPGGWASVLVLVLIVLGLAFLLLRTAAKATKSAAGAAELYDERILSAAEHRAAATDHAQRQEWAAAVRERLRAIARDLEERAIVDPQPGRTADEFAVEAGRALPEFAAELATAARHFDDVTYGEKPGDPESYGMIAALDERLQGARPVSAVHR